MAPGEGKACVEWKSNASAARRVELERPDAPEDQKGRPLAPLGRSFYARPVLRVARDCIGKLLVSRDNGLLLARIVEVEAYRGPLDRAAHSFGGRRTPRTEVMFGPPGHAYIFMLYGLHYNLNLVTGQIGQPEAVLIRAVEPLEGLKLMAARRNVPTHKKVLTNGPGKLCQAFGITKADYGVDLTRGRLFLSEGEAGPVGRSRRIGIDYAGEWAAKAWRFFERGNMYVSHPRESTS